MRLVEEKTVEFIPETARGRVSELLEGFFSFSENSLHKVSLVKTASIEAKAADAVVSKNPQPVALKKRRVCHQS